ncbi:TQO small subunit DoxA domain-containing protein, partial [Gelidibacter japonicus]
YFMKKNYAFTKKKWFAWLGSGVLPIKDRLFPKIVLAGALFIFGLTLYTNQVFHGGVWGTLHNKSVKPKLEITEGKIDHNGLSFDVYRTEGVDVYGAWMIDITLTDAQGDTVINYQQDDLASMDKNLIDNYYIAKVKPGAHSLIIPLGAKANINFKDEVLMNLPKGEYTLKITDISGANWDHSITK